MSTSASSVPTVPSARVSIPLQCDDVSAFAKALRTQLLAHVAQHSAAPSHLALLNMLARATGLANFQALKAQTQTQTQAQALRTPAAVSVVESISEPVIEATAVQSSPTAQPLTPTAAKALSQFDAQGRLTRWPNKFSVQRLAMWGLWLRFDASRQYSEREVNTILKAWTVYGDHVTPRRELIEMGLLGRKSDCSAYWKELLVPSDEVQALLRALRSRR